MSGFFAVFLRVLLFLHFHPTNTLNFSIPPLNVISFLINSFHAILHLIHVRNNSWFGAPPVYNLIVRTGMRNICSVSYPRELSRGMMERKQKLELLIYIR